MYDRDHIEKPTSRKVEATFSPIHIKRCLECRTPLAGSGGRDVYCAKCRLAATNGLTWDTVSRALL